ncbi:MAG: Bro-N domain-containing protein, partial [Selenomonadaceae bacterium]|nr:Bro-N domain-containing protein [Selenomonadaceae bacterium]
MSMEIQIFNHPEFGGVRVIGDADNPRFCLADVCKILEIGNPSDVKKRLDDGVVTIEVISDSLGRAQNATFVNEDGLYDVILDSRKPEAKKFRKWVTSEVLPSIRKHGVYATGDFLSRSIADPTWAI